TAGSGRRAGRARRPAAPPRPRNTAGSSRQVLPGHVLVDTGFGGQAENAFGDDVAQDLRGAALDRVALGPQVAVAGAAAVEVDALGAAEGVVVVAQVAQELHLQPGQGLVELGE